MKEQKITCIVCPLGCEITVKTQGGNITEVSGHACKRGEKYAAIEVSDPRRTITTTMRVVGADIPLVSVKTSNPIPKHLMFESMKNINKTTVNAPVKIGDVLVENILDTGVNIVATTSAL